MKFILIGLFVSVSLISSLAQASNALIYFSPQKTDSDQRLSAVFDGQKSPIVLSKIKKLCELEGREVCDEAGVKSLVSLGFKNVSTYTDNALSSPIENYVRFIQSAPKKDNEYLLLMSAEADPVTDTLIIFVNAEIFKNLTDLEKATLNWSAHLFKDFYAKKKELWLDQLAFFTQAVLSVQATDLTNWRETQYYGQVYETLFDVNWIEFFGLRFKNRYPSSFTSFSNLRASEGELGCFQLQNKNLFLTELPCRGWIPIRELEQRYSLTFRFEPFKVRLNHDTEIEVSQNDQYSAYYKGVVSSDAIGFRLSGAAALKNQMVIRVLSQDLEVARPEFEFESVNGNGLNFKSGYLSRTSGLSGFQFEYKDRLKFSISLSGFDLNQMNFARNETGHYFVTAVSSKRFDRSHYKAIVNEETYNSAGDFRFSSTEKDYSLTLDEAEWNLSRTIETEYFNFKCGLSSLVSPHLEFVWVKLNWTSENQVEPKVAGILCESVTEIDFKKRVNPELVSLFISNSIRDHSLKVYIDDFKYSRPTVIGTQSASEAAPFEYPVLGDFTVIEKQPFKFSLVIDQGGFYFDTESLGKSRDAEVRDSDGNVNMAHIHELYFHEDFRFEKPMLEHFRFDLMKHGLFSKPIRLKMGENILVPKWRYSPYVHGLKLTAITIDHYLNDSLAALSSEEGFRKMSLLCSNGKKLSLSKKDRLTDYDFKFFKIKDTWTIMHDQCD